MIFQLIVYQKLKNTLNDYCLKLGLNQSEPLEVLDLGCGWGSFSLFASKKYPQHNYTALSNSKSQKDFIDSKIKKLMF